MICYDDDMLRSCPQLWLLPLWLSVLTNKNVELSATCWLKNDTDYRRKIFHESLNFFFRSKDIRAKYTSGGHFLYHSAVHLIRMHIV